MKPRLPNVLATRYASPEMAELWSPATKVVLERRLWIAVLRAQAELGIEVEPGVIEAYEAVVDQVDLDSIEDRERVTRHDVKARIEEFSALAGFEQIHKGMTSRDLTENVEQLQIRTALELVRDRLVAVLARLAELAAEHADTVITGRTHNVAAQATTLGKRFANAGEETLQAYRRVEELIDRYPLRGVKGPVGTQQDQLDLLDGDLDRLDRLEAAVAAHLGFDHVLANVGPGVPPLAGPRRGQRAGPGRGRPLQPGAHHSAHGWPRAGHRGLPARAGRVVGHAPQDEHPLVRAHQRLRGDPPGSPHHGRGSGRGPVERGRRELFGGAASRPARRLLRHGRRVPDPVVGPARTSGPTPPSSPASSSATSRSWPPRRCSWPRCRPGWGARSPTRPSRSTRWRSPWPSASREPRATTSSSASPPTLASASTPGALAKLLAEPIDFVGAAPHQVAAFVTAVEAVVATHPEAAGYTPEEIL